MAHGAKCIIYSPLQTGMANLRKLLKYRRRTLTKIIYIIEISRSKLTGESFGRLVFHRGSLTPCEALGSQIIPIPNSVALLLA